MENKGELIKFIKSFNKERGQYTLDEELEIGRMMKTLPEKERGWNWLHDYLGITEFSPNAYRSRVNRYINNGSFLDGNMDDDAIAYKDAYKSKYKERQWVNAFRRAVREDIRVDNFKEEIQLAVSKINALPQIVPNSVNLQGDNVKREAVLLLSDLHIGVECDNYYNSYNSTIAHDRLMNLAKKVISYCRENKVGKLNILNLGDNIHGIIHTNARIEQEMDVIEQVMTAAEYISQFLNGLTQLGITITYRSVFDNHSRIIADKTQNIEKEQFSRLIDWYLHERLKDKPISFIEDNIDGGIGRFKIFDKPIMFAHGHQDGRNNTVQSFIGLTREWVDYICLAHYHNPAVKDYQGVKVFINGSVVGTEQYTFGRRLFTKPSQKLIIFEDNNNDIIDIDVML